MKMNPQEAGEKIDTLVKEFTFSNPEFGYETALHKVLEMYPELKEIYAGVQDQPVNPKRDLDFYIDGPPRNVREEVHRRVKDAMSIDGELDYAEAMRLSFIRDPDLMARYAKS